MARRKTAKRSSKKKSNRRAKKPAGGGKLPKEAVTMIVHLRSREGQEMLLEAELRALVGPTRKEEGCLVYDLHRSLDGAGAFLLHEVWATREAHTAHTRTDHFLRWNARKDAMTSNRESNFWKLIV